MTQDAPDPAGAEPAGGPEPSSRPEPGSRPERTERVRSRGGSRASRPPQRVRVTSPRMAASAPRPTAHPVTREIDEQTGLGEVFMRSLLRTQLRLGLSAVAVLALAIGTLPLVFAVIPRLGAVRVFTLPLTWWLTGIAIYPVMIGTAWWHVHASERVERDFTEIVEGD